MLLSERPPFHVPTRFRFKISDNPALPGSSTANEEDFRGINFLVQINKSHRLLLCLQKERALSSEASTVSLHTIGLAVRMP